MFQVIRDSKNLSFKKRKYLFKIIKEKAISYGIIKGDSKFLSIAAASILAKVFRNEPMFETDILHPKYNWKRNVGYPTKEHIAAIQELGVTDLHRRSFGICKL